ncbi:MAG: hypothetical protein KJZ83_08055 [Burkholderiaceae bacterium]|nr:hypothetical protein [Burkholderiaceae bacterium]
MLFSLFGRREKSDAGRLRTAPPGRVADTTVRGPATVPSIEAQRELARLTAEKIDLIESEMMPGSAPASALAPTLPMPRGRTVEALPRLEIETVSVLDHAATSVGAIEVNASSLAPELEEAAILYANSQSRAAVATLGEALARRHNDPVALQAFRMRFDVLVSLGAREEFEACAIDFAARFERSPPPWRGELVPVEAVSVSRASTTLRFTPRLDASCVRLFEQGRRACLAGKAVTLDFSQINSIEAQGATGLCALIGALEQSRCEVVVASATTLYQVARAAIEPGRRDDSDALWRTALLTLRMLGDQQAFDDLAIEYCVTFELSPPSWEPPPQRFRTSADKASRVRPDAAGAGPASDPLKCAADAEAFVLRGELAGRIGAELAALREHAASRTQVTIDCRSLLRLDFVAAGELLNELVALATQGKTAVFDQPSAIVEALLTVMGISELAEVRGRAH